MPFYSYYYTNKLLKVKRKFKMKFKMKLSNFNYDLPTKFIAQKPVEPRDHSKLLKLDKNTWKISEGKFYDILDDFWKNDVIVVNKTKVLNAKLRGELETGLEVEIFLHTKMTNNSWDCLVYPWKKLKPWTTVFLPLNKGKNPKGDGGFTLTAKIKEISENGRIVEFDKWWIDFLEIVEKLGEIPLPPYIKEKIDDSDRYQTVFNENLWSVAAPTAWLHFTPELIKKLRSKWVIFEKVLLHVGLGTFMWVETENILEHKMHSEYIELEKGTACRLNKYKSEWKRIIAVWTTSIRVLESFSDSRWVLEHWNKDTDIFIYPWYKWRFIDAIITNFHLPKSTLLMLVSSFAWQENIKKAYNYAIKNNFRFFSFWDAMLIKF